ncbi:lytic transglycosylase [Pasteurella testudinis]|uniref:lytic transglycosylase n=1 Tax=Pasteurella testudinis TaxID=761 RepID=UPI0040586207
MAKTRLLRYYCSCFALSSLQIHAAIPQAYQEIAAQQNVPAKMLFAISLNESGTKLASKKVLPWPWTLNVAGKSYFYPTREAACSALQDFVKRFPLKNIDVGLAQVNIGWNGKRFFSNHCDGFEPFENLRVASIILKTCYNTHKDWVNAAGCYHHPKGGAPAKRYKAGIRAKLARIEKMSPQPSPSFLKTKPLEARPTLVFSAQTALEEPTANFNWVTPTEKALLWVEPADINGDRL